jgi:transposase
MPGPMVSRDLKAWILVLFHEQGFNIKEICGLLGLKKSLVYYTLQHTHTYGVPYNPYTLSPGQKHIFSQGDVRFIIVSLSHRHCTYLDEIQKQLSSECRVNISISTLWRTLHHLQYSYKHVSIRTLEWNDLLRSAFMNRIANEVTNPNMLMFADKAAHNKTTLGRPKGWSLVGKRCVQRWCFRCGERFSILSILTLGAFKVATYFIIIFYLMGFYC